MDCIQYDVTSAGRDLFDFILRGGTVYDGRSGAPYLANVGVRGDRVVRVGDLSRAQADISRCARACRCPRFLQHSVSGAGVKKA